MNLTQLHIKLTKELPEYQYSLKKRFGREFIIVKKDTYRGAEIFKNEDRFQIIPMVPTMKGKMMFGSGINWAKHFIKNYSEVSDKVFNHIINQELGLKISTVSKAEDIERTQSGQRNDEYALLVLGLLSIGLGVFLFYELSELETTGGELNISGIIALIYENLGKEVVMGALGILGGYFIYDGNKKLRES